MKTLTCIALTIIAILSNSCCQQNYPCTPRCACGACCDCEDDCDCPLCNLAPVELLRGKNKWEV